MTRQIKAIMTGDQPAGIVRPMRQDVLLAERCDRCGADARVMLVKGGLTLMVCAHHFTRYSLTMLADGWTVAADSREQPLAR